MAATTVMEFSLYIPEVGATRADQGTKWADTLEAIAPIIHARMNEVIPDNTAYLNKIASPSIDGYSTFPDAAYVSKKGLSFAQIKEKHAKNIKLANARRRQKWDEKFNGDVSQYDLAVRAYKNLWGEAASLRSLRLTGDKMSGQGAVTIASFLITGDLKGEAMLRGSDVFSGTITDIAIPLTTPIFKSAIIQTLIKAGILIFRSDLEAARITEQNTVIVAKLNPLIDATYDPLQEVNELTSYLKYEIVDELLRIKGKITTP